MYRAALRLRREYRLGSGTLTWEAGDFAFANGDLLVVTNFGPDPVPAPPDVLLASGELTGDDLIPVDTTVWVRRTG
jgi:alpha-glucosidase